MSITAHIGWQPDDHYKTHFERKLQDAVHITYGNEPPEHANYDILIKGRPTEDDINASDKLKAVIVPFAGIPDVTSTLMEQNPHITLHNLHHNAIPTAEMALGLLMAVARGIVPAHNRFVKHDWSSRHQPNASFLLSGKTALILGYGTIGEHLGTILRAMGMTVIGTRRRYPDEARNIYPAEVTTNLLPQADVLIVALPATPETTDLLGARELGLLPKGAILINIGRAAVINQNALYGALRRKHLFGAGLDVWYNYPKSQEERKNTPPADLPFHELDNVVMSPHRAGDGGNDEIEFLRFNALAQAINAAANDEPIPHQVDLSLGY